MLMKKSNYFLLAAVAFSIALSSCDSSKNSSNSMEKAYTMASKSKDRETVISSLTLWLANDSSIGKWAYDTLAYYHYFYRVTPGAVRNPATPKYYAEEGLKLNPNNLFLRDIKAKLLLEEGKDTASFDMFAQMWKETGDMTYYWDMTFIEIARNKIGVADSMVQSSLKLADISKKKVKMEHIQAQITENVNAAAAFYYLDALIKNAQRNVIGAAESLKKALDAEPEFYAARRTIMELQRMSSGQQ